MASSRLLTNIPAEYSIRFVFAKLVAVTTQLTIHKTVKQQV